MPSPFEVRLAEAQQRWVAAMERASAECRAEYDDWEEVFDAIPALIADTWEDALVKVGAPDDRQDLAVQVVTEATYLFVTRFVPLVWEVTGA